MQKIDRNQLAKPAVAGGTKGPSSTMYVNNNNVIPVIVFRR